MSEIKVRMRCGCIVALGSADDAPRCGPHQEFRVSMTYAPAPRITGTASGPHVTTTDLDPLTVSFTHA